MTGDRRAGTAAGLLAGVALDALFGDPRHGHPVAAFGRAAAALETRMYGDSRGRGSAYTAACVLGVTALGHAADRLTRGRPAARMAVTAAATWAVLGGASLGREGAGMADSLEAGDLAAARRRLPHLCARDPRHLNAAALTRATVESIAENTSDAAVAPLLWGAVAGLPGLIGYRAINTLDAMVGYRSDRYLRFGWAAARLDDMANWIPARLTGLFTVACAPVIGGDPRRSWAILRRDGAAHPSPNAGRCEAAFAGALGVRLGGTNRYGGRVPEPYDIHRAVRLSRAVTLVAAVCAAAFARRGPRRRAIILLTRSGGRASLGKALSPDWPEIRAAGRGRTRRAPVTRLNNRWGS